MHLSNRKPLDLSYDQLVVGSSLEAFLIAWYGKAPVIYTRNQIPYFFETIPDFGMGTDKLKLWNSIAYQLSIAGYNPFENKISHIRNEGRNLLKAITTDGGVYNITYNKLFVFDDWAFENLPGYTGKTSDDNLVVDYLRLDRAKKRTIGNIARDDNILQKIIFLDEAKSELIAVSNIKDADLSKYEDYLIKIKCETILRENGVQDSDRKRINLEHKRREIVSLGQNIYTDFDDIYFVYSDLKTIDQFALKWTRIDYMKYFRLKMGM
jgi:hypothetical protein